MEQASLIQDEGESGHFLSISAWADTASRAAWRKSPDFAQKFGAAKALCDEMTNFDGERQVTI